MGKANTARKLDRRGRDLIRERLICGDTNGQVRTALTAAGYPTVNDSTLSFYRRDPEVVAACAAVDLEARQVAMAQRSRRIVFVDSVLKKCIAKLNAPGLSWPQYCRIGAEIRVWLDVMSKLVDEPADRIAAAAAQHRRG